MIIIVAGASRSGKSLLAIQLCQKHNFNYYPLDPVISTLENLYPETKIKHQDDNLYFSPVIAEFIKELIGHLEYEGLDLILDTYQLYPQDYHKVFPARNVPIIYLGYPDLTPERKLNHIKAQQRKEDWTADTDDQALCVILEDFIRESLVMKDQCEELDIPFFDTGMDFKKGINKAYTYTEKLIRADRNKITTG